MENWTLLLLLSGCWLAGCGTATGGGGSSSLEKIVEEFAASVAEKTASLILRGTTSSNGEMETSGRLGTRNTGTPGVCLPRDCADVARSGRTGSGVYRVWPDGWSSSCGIEVFCDLEKNGGGWTVIQRRGQFDNPKDYFYRRWRDYKYGFGNLTQEFWLGNDKLHQLSNQDNYVLRVDLKSKDGETRYALYDEFYIEPESNKYKLWIYGFTGDAGDSLSSQNGMFFGTRDRDNDNFERNCAEEFKGAWWYNKCHESNLNGLNLDGQHESFADGIDWKAWKGYHYSYPQVEIKIRPKFYRGTPSRREKPVSRQEGFFSQRK